MTALQQLNAYLRRMESRFRALAASRGIAAVVALALGLTLLLVWIANRYQFADQIVLPLRILLFAAIALVVAFALAIPLLRANRRRLARLAEKRVPEFEQRLLTAERQDPRDPFAEIVAEDTLRIAREHQPEEFARPALLYGFAAAAVAIIGVLVWLVAAGPGFWGYGASLLWTGNASASRRPIYAIEVQPGNQTVRRASDQAITARLVGFSSPAVYLHARYDGALKWEKIPMQTEPAGNEYRFLFAGLSQGVEYYVQAGAKQSHHYRLAVMDLPAVKRVRVKLHFPSDLGLQDVTTNSGGDIRAVRGAQAEISVLTDRPLKEGALVLQDGSRIPLTQANGGWLAAHLSIRKSGAYHVAALQNGQAIRISDDYMIEARTDEPPVVKIASPGRDTHVSPIEELPVSVSASDDFGVENLELHYSVDGGPEKVVPLLRQKGAKLAGGRATIDLENFNLVPGDVVSYYATARDVKTTSRSDIYFAQAEPFDLKFTQSQQSGGMGGGAGDQAQRIVERQKEIIAATFNELRAPKQSAAAGEDGRALSQAQAKLADEEKTLADRMGYRELTGQSSQLTQMSKLMKEAAGHMRHAANQLKSAQWKASLPPEEKAFQSLNRIEAMYRNFQIAYGQMGGAAMNGARRDLARMFDLEMDLSKNQYETAQSAHPAAGSQQKKIDQAFAKLQALARRQQQLAMRHRDQKPFEQRWQEERLRRQAEQLRRQMQQMAGGSQNQTGNSQNRAGSGSAQNGGQNQQMREAMRQATQALRQAEQALRQAADGNTPGAEQRAAEQLARAQNALSDALHRQSQTSLANLRHQAQQLTDAQRRIAEKMQQMYGSSANPFGSNRFSPNRSGRQTAQNKSGPGGGVSMPEMNDPMHPIPYGYGRYWYRRGYLRRFTPPHMPTPEERTLSAEKERLAKKVEKLEQQLQQQVQNMAAAQPDAAQKLRQALAALQQEDLAMRMRKTAQWMQQGFGGLNLGTEQSLTQGLQQLSRNLGQTEQAMRSGKLGRQGQGNQAEEALNDLRALRQQMQQARGQSSAQQGNSQAEDGAWGPLGTEGPGVDRDDLKMAITDLNRLRAKMRPNDHTYRDLDYALGYLVRLYHANPNVLRSAINDDAVTHLERLELELSHRVNGQAAGAARTAAPETAPQKYRDAVANYFKTLSQ